MQVSAMQVGRLYLVSGSPSCRAVRFEQPAVAGGRVAHAELVQAMPDHGLIARHHRFTQSPLDRLDRGQDPGVLLLVVLATLYFWTNVSRVLLFWAAFILTRPLGATVGDFLDKPIEHGGLALSRPIASAVIAVLMIMLVLVLPQRAGSHPGGESQRVA